MTYTEQAIQKAKKSGYDVPRRLEYMDGVGADFEDDISAAFLDPLFWQSLGKGLSNNERAIGLGTKCYQCAECKYDKPTLLKWLLDIDGDPCPKHLNMAFTEWLHDKKTAESFFESLINVKG